MASLLICRSKQPAHSGRITRKLVCLCLTLAKMDVCQQPNRTTTWCSAAIAGSLRHRSEQRTYCSPQRRGMVFYARLGQRLPLTHPPAIFRVFSTASYALRTTWSLLMQEYSPSSCIRRTAIFGLVRKRLEIAYCQKMLPPNRLGLVSGISSFANAPIPVI